MKYYEIDLCDYPKTSWALHQITKLLPKRKKAEGMPPVFYKFFPLTREEVCLKPQYQHLCCKKCGRYDADAMFDIGFDDPVVMRFKGDFGWTNDRTFVVDDKFLGVLKREKVGGYETKPLGKSGWHALRATLLVDCVEGVVKSNEPNCSECGRPKESYGLFEQEDQLSLPGQPNTFFTTKKSWCRHSRDRQIFITEDVLQALQKEKIKGGYCTRLLTRDEVKKLTEKAEKEKREIVSYYPLRGTTVFLK